MKICVTIEGFCSINSVHVFCTGSCEPSAFSYMITCSQNATWICLCAQIHYTHIGLVYYFLLEGCLTSCFHTTVELCRLQLAWTGHVQCDASSNQTVWMNAPPFFWGQMSCVGSQTIEAEASCCTVILPVMHAQSLLCRTRFYERPTSRVICFKHHVIDGTSSELLWRNIWFKGVPEFENSTAFLRWRPQNVLWSLQPRSCSDSCELQGLTLRNGFIQAQ